MEIENKIRKTIEELGCHRLDAISVLGLGERSEAAKRASKNRMRRKELVEGGIDFKTACEVVKMENEQLNL